METPQLRFPANIAPMSRAVWGSESDGFATGTEGSVTYETGVGQIFIHWDNPFAGSNGLGVDVPRGFHFDHEGIDGNNVGVTITVTPEV
jgi:hypothetical protein